MQTPPCNTCLPQPSPHRRVLGTNLCPRYARSASVCSCISSCVETESTLGTLDQCLTFLHRTSYISSLTTPIKIMVEPNLHSSKPLENDDGTLQSLYDYISQYRILTTRGLKHDFISEGWFRPDVNVEEVTIWDVIGGNGSALSVISIENGSTELQGAPSGQVRIETWMLNGPQEPYLVGQHTIPHAQVIVQSLLSTMEHLDVPPLTTEQEIERTDASTTMTLAIVSFLTGCQVPRGPFSATLPGNYWEEVAVLDNIVVLARRKGPRRPQDAGVPDLDEEVRDIFEQDFEPRYGSEVSLSDNGEAGLEVGEGFMMSDSESAEKEVDLSPISRSPVSAGSVADYENWDLNEAESIHSLRIHSDSEEQETDSNNDELMGPHSGMLSTCNVCRRETVGHLYCHICGGGAFSMCARCRERGCWCNDEEHKMADCPDPACPVARTVSVRDPGTQLELVVFDTHSGCESPVYRFMQERGHPTPMSLPALHPTAPILAWYLGENRLLFANYKNGSHFVRREPGWRHEGMSCQGRDWPQSTE